MEEITGKIFNIQKCSIRDGRGMRTTVFFKGCSLHCLWCANPEGISFSPEIALNSANCMGCGFCLEGCPEGAVYFNEQGKIYYDRSKCMACGVCARLCPTEARKYFGQQYTAEEVFQHIYRDRFYFEHSGGGVTFSGGEALMQPEFLLEIARKCKMHRIHVVIETGGCAIYEKFAPCLDYIDFIYFDIKHMNSRIHKKITGQTNEVILNNLKRMDRHGIEICVRTPVVPGWNDTDVNIRETAEFIAEFQNIRRYELLAYHTLGINKYRTLGRRYMLKNVQEPEKEQMQYLVDEANKILLPVGKKCFYNSENSADE